MDIVTSRATHLCRRAIAFASLKKSHLVAMNIRMLNTGRRKRFEEFTEGLTGNVRECGRQGFSLNPIVAFGAQVDLPVARKLRRIQNAALRTVVRRGRALRLLPNMIRAG